MMDIGLYTMKKLGSGASPDPNFYCRTVCFYIGSLQGVAKGKDEEKKNPGDVTLASWGDPC
jgi:hypothetical protein